MVYESIIENCLPNKVKYYGFMEFVFEDFSLYFSTICLRDWRVGSAIKARLTTTCFRIFDKFYALKKKKKKSKARTQSWDSRQAVVPNFTT